MAAPAPLPAPAVASSASPQPQLTHTALPLGTQLLGRYVVTKLVQTSLFGHIYLCRDQKSDPAVHVIIKMSDLQRATQGLTGVNFIVHEDVFHEVACMQALGLRSSSSSPANEQQGHGDAVLVAKAKGTEANPHALYPYLIRLLDVQEDERFHYMILEYAAGGDLFQNIQRFETQKQRIPEEWVRKAFAQLCVATLYMHERGITHLDISSENVLVCADGSVRLGDLGLALPHPARVIPDCSMPMHSFPSWVLTAPDYPFGKRQTTSTRGKSGCMSPEAWFGLPYDLYRADSYGLGIVLFMMLTSSKPYDSPKDAHFWVIYSGLFLEGPAVWKMQAPIFQEALALLMPVLEGVDRSALELVRHLVCRDAERWTVMQALQHPWVQRTMNQHKKQQQEADKQGREEGDQEMHDEHKESMSSPLTSARSDPSPVVSPLFSPARPDTLRDELRSPIASAGGVGIMCT